MKKINRFKLQSFMLLVMYILSACAGAPAAATSVGADKSVAQPVTYLGVIESINGDAWTINGVLVTVNPDIVRDGPFAVGDQIKVEAVVNPDGSLAISRVEAPTVDDLSTLPGLGNDNTNDTNSNDANSNDDLNSNDNNTNTFNSNDDSNSNDDNSNDENENDSNSNNDDDDANDNG